MNIVEQMDLAIKSKEVGTTDGGYEVFYKGELRSKQAYMRKDEWQAFLNGMSPEARKEYGDGGGDELSEKNGRPPKMASYGSSSRMIYVLSRGKSDFHYEKKLPTTVGGTANLDGFLEDDTHRVFVEAKCHEPYTAKRNVVSVCYADVYQYINDHMPKEIRIEWEIRKDGRTMNVGYFAKNEKLERFDMKQMICHLLGIATGLLKGTLKKKPTDFIYLLYDPTALDISPDAKEEIKKNYSRTCYECNLIDFAKLFCVILEFLRETKYHGAMSDDEIQWTTDHFTFTLASQVLYPILISYIAGSKEEETFYITKDNVDGTKEVIYRLKCDFEQACAVYHFVIREQQKEYHAPDSTIFWRIVRLFDSATDRQLAQES